jgi:phosphoglycolate phosphatase
VSNLDVWCRHVLGFDLDMTLVDTRMATAFALREVNRLLGTRVDVESCVAAIGLPLRGELARWIPAEKLDDAIRTFIAVFRSGGLRRVQPLPGARELVDALRRGGGSSVVITGRSPRMAVACLRTCGLSVPVVVGSVSGPAKTPAMRTHRVAAYFGDHPMDMASAVAAATTGVGVLTGSHPAADLSRAGARLVLPTLHDLGDVPFDITVRFAAGDCDTETG